MKNSSFENGFYRPYLKELIGTFLFYATLLPLNCLLLHGF
jgi:hypothetical protein